MAQGAGSKKKKVFYYYMGLLSTMGYSVVSMKNQYKF